ncbi:hypothetical protein CSC94_06860 [Zhengella mangrovi]|uniref:Uncharacterized protein n=1 Tax=Zhengella mangrovi TaxID=1982044 RepID=A0A2G1QSA0_9HYPH|nr:DUF6107 family protein [Zhengella mangrovi]PHP68359.1 hypothetical protein CSC94_06860 [Zhengella mangrovi]
MSDTHVMWAAKGAGAVAGSAISLAYLLPSGRREAALRFFVGLVSGLVFGGMAGLMLVERLDLKALLSPVEVMLAGSAFASLSAWWALGLLMRLMAHHELRQTPESPSQGPESESESSHASH